MRIQTATLTLAAVLFAWLASLQATRAHCQVPCGIYDDGARLAAMREDATTIGKAVAQVAELSGRHDAAAFNQAARWVVTKEEHASRIITTVAEYFLTQKVQPPKEASKEALDHYHEVLAANHAVMRAAMVTKQTVDPAAVAALNAAIDALASHFTSEPPAEPKRLAR